MRKSTGKVTSACHYQSEAATAVSGSSAEQEAVSTELSFACSRQSFTFGDGGKHDGCRRAVTSVLRVYVCALPHLPVHHAAEFVLHHFLFSLWAL